MAGAELLELSDDAFRARWPSLTDEERKQIPRPEKAACIERYRKLTPWLDKSIERLTRGQAKLDAMPPKPKPLDWSELVKYEPPERVWAIVMWIAMNVPTLLVGAGGAGKTLLMLLLGACMALGRQFIDDIPRPLRVLMWCCEDDADELWRRSVRIAEWLGVTLDQFSDFIIVPRLGLDNTVYTCEFGRPMFTPAFEELRVQAGDYNVDVLLLDNSAQLFGGQENDRHQVTEFVNRLMGAHRERAIVLAAHPSRQNGSEFSGSSAWENAVRTRLYLGRTMPDQPVDDDVDADENVRYLARRKANYGPKDYRKLTLQNGVLVPDQAEVSGGMVNHIREQQAGRIVVDAVRKLHDMGVRATHGSTSPNYLPRLILEYRLGEGCSKKDLATAMREAMLDGKLTRGVVGKYPNRNPMEGLIAP